MNKIIIIVFLLIGIIVFCLFRKNERFYPLEDVKSKEMLNSLNYAVADILDNKKYKFSGYLIPLNFQNYHQKITLQEGYSSFTENKRKIVLCMKNEHGELYNFNSLLYVLLHEIAHVINDELHHTKKFQKIFNELLRHAEMLGYYNSKLPFESNYCT